MFLITEKMLLDDAFFASEDIKLVVILSIVDVCNTLSPSECTYVTRVSFDRSEGLQLVSDVRLASLIYVPEFYQRRIFAESCD